MITLRPFDRDAREDCLALVALHNGARPSDPISVAALQGEANKQTVLKRWLIEDAGQVFGCARCGQPPHRLKVGHYAFDVVLQEGVGAEARAAAFDLVLKAMEPLKPIEISIRSTEDESERIALLAASGFTPKARFPRCELTLADFEPARYTAQLTNMLDSGLRIVSFEEQLPRDPSLIEQLAELEWAIHRDLPGPDQMTRVSAEQFAAGFEADSFMARGYLIACAEDRYVGLTTLIQSAIEPGRLHTGLTGILPAHRRRGIATALKIYAIERARGWGTKVIQATNELTNPMRTINQALGFQPIAGIVIYKRTR